MYISKGCSVQECLGTDTRPGNCPRLSTGGRQDLAGAASVRVGDYEVAGGRLLRHEWHPLCAPGAAVLGPALYVWPEADGFWLESARGGFGLPGIHEMRADAWAGAVSTMHRRYEPAPGKVKSVIDYVWQAWFHRTAVTPFGAFEAESPEAMEALEACAVRRGCIHD